MNKTIDYRFKIIYAIAIILVVCGHAGGGGINFWSEWFPYGGFHLALFMFTSGYFYKEASESSVVKYIISKFKRTIIPLYIYTFVYAIIVQISRLKGFSIGNDISWYNLFISPITNGHAFVYNMGGWFLVPLFMVEAYNVVVHAIVHKINKNVKEVFFFIAAVVLGIIGNELACLGYASSHLLVLIRMLYFLPFYSLGILYKTNLEKYDRKVPSIIYFGVIFAVNYITSLFFGRVISYTPSWCNNFHDGPIMPIVIGILGIAFWLRVATVLEPVIGKSRCVNIIADNTFSIMMNQFIGFMLVKTVFALISKTGLAFSSFDWISYKTKIWWYYCPRGIAQGLILYTIAGIAVPIGIQYVINNIRNRIKEHM